MRRIALVMIFTLFGLFQMRLIYATNPDSLFYVLEETNTDSTRLQILKSLGDYYQNNKPDSAIICYDEAIKIAKQQSFKAVEIELLQQKGIALDIKGDKEALIYLESAKKGFEEMKDSLGTGRAAINIGIYYHWKSLYDDAMTHYLEAYDIFQQIGDKVYLSRVLNNLAILYRKQEKYNRALEIYEQSLEIKRDIGDSTGVGTALMNMATTYNYMGNKEKMMEYFDASINQYERLNQDENVAYCRMSLGEGLVNHGEYALAEANLEAALEHYQYAKHTRSYGFILANLGVANNQQGEYQNTIDLLEPELDSIRSRGRIEITQSFLNSLSKAKAAMGSYQVALQYLNEATEIKDSMAVEKRVSITEEMQSRFDVAQKEKELLIANLQIEKKNQQQKIYFYWFGIALLLLAGGAYWLYQKSKTNQLLSEKNEIIRNALKEKEGLVEEIQNRVEHNLQFISSLLHLQTEHLANNSAIVALQESKHRVASMSLLHHNLYQQDQYSNIDLKKYIQELIENTLRNYKESFQSISVQEELDPILVDVDRAIPIGLLINEVLTSVFKHNIDQQCPSKVYIAIKERNDQLNLEISEMLKTNLKLHKPMIIRSFGLKLINLLISQLNATWEESDQPGKYLRVSIPK